MPAQDASPLLIWELKELALSASCREAMAESAALSTLCALLAEEDLPDEAHVYAIGAVKVRPRGDYGSGFRACDIGASRCAPRGV